MTEYVLNPSLFVMKTERFSVIDASPVARDLIYTKTLLQIDWECAYTRDIIHSTAARRPWCSVVSSLPDASSQTSETKMIQVADFENIVWDDVLAGKMAASSYLVRKGLSRKAQLSLQLRRFCSKHPQSVLKKAVPKTIIIETWNAFEEDMRLDIGGGLQADFDLPGMKRAPLRQRLDWTLADVRHEMETYVEHQRTSKSAEQPEMWILKPSVANKGADISIVRDWDEVLDALEATEDMREWVLQEYIAQPLLINRGYKFHFRVYVLCIGALKVFVFDEILMLLAAHKYFAEDTEDILCHLTNTARAAEDIEFKEEKFVKLMTDLPQILHKEYRARYPTLQIAEDAVRGLKDQIHAITGELFAAYENEYSIFCPMPQCYELYGLDFIVDNDMQVHLLEVNPGPDFKQTGGRLRRVIIQLWEQVFRLTVDLPLLFAATLTDAVAEKESNREESKQKNIDLIKVSAPDFTLVYDKMWSVSQLKHSISLK